jgi:SpoIID/LytB domain protein
MAGRERSRRDLLIFLSGLCASVVRRASGQVAPGPGAIPLRIGFARPGGGYSIQSLPVETYVARVLAGEAARDSPPAAHEALAVTIRTFGLGNRERHRADGFDLCDQTHCQVVRTATAATVRAAQATAGQVLLGGAGIASVFYSASCGGRTEIPSNVWPGADDPPYLPSLPDTACEGAPLWNAELPGSDLLTAFRAAGFRGNLRGMTIASRNRSGRVARLTLDGLAPGEISGQDLRVVVGRTLGWQHIKSTTFELRRQGAAYRFSGRGSGHGVGLCVIGATNLAARGTPAPVILEKYFPGLSIGPAVDPTGSGAAPSQVASDIDGITVVLPDADAGERPAIAGLTARLRNELASTLAVTAPAAMTVRVHATIDEYRRATGRPWFTSGAWLKGELHLVPLAVLREGGGVERTIRHELVHALADDVLAARPAWVREGAAIYFAGERPIPGGPAVRPRTNLEGGCPGDGELLQPISIGALADAYARARVCFERQLANGKRWRDVK